MISATWLMKMEAKTILMFSVGVTAVGFSSVAAASSVPAVVVFFSFGRIGTIISGFLERQKGARDWYSHTLGSVYCSST